GEVIDFEQCIIEIGAGTPGGDAAVFADDDVGGLDVLRTDAEAIGVVEGDTGGKSGGGRGTFGDINRGRDDGVALVGGARSRAVVGNPGGMPRRDGKAPGVDEVW